jgi:hypothetical protein
MMSFDLRTYTLIHTAISLVGIASGFVVLYGLLKPSRLDRWTALFLASTVATSVTGFGFPLTHFGAPHWVGVISLAVLAAAIFARYIRRLAGAWRWIYVFTAALALYLNVFVGVVQAFQKLSPLKALAPTQTELPFLFTQLVVLAIFIALTFVATRRFRVEPAGVPVTTT